MPPKPVVAEPVGFNLPGVNPEPLESLFQGMQSPGTATTTGVKPEVQQSRGFQQGMANAIKAMNQYNSFAAANLVARSTPGKNIKGFIRLPKEENRGDPQDTFSLGNLNPVTTLAKFLMPAKDVYVPQLEGEDVETAVARYRKSKEFWDSPETKALRGTLAARNAAMPWLQGLRMVGSPIIPEAYAQPLRIGEGLEDRVRALEPYVGAGGKDQFLGGITDPSVVAFGAVSEGTGSLLTAGGRRLLQSGLGQSAMKGFQTGLGRATFDVLHELPVASRTGQSLLEGTSHIPRTTQVFDWVGYKLGTRAFRQIRPSTIRAAEEALDKAGGFLEMTPQGGVNLHFSPGVAQGSEAAVAAKGAMRSLLSEMQAAGSNATARAVYGGKIVGQAVAGATADVVGSVAGVTAGMAPKMLSGTPEEQAAYREAYPEAVAEGLKWGAGFGLARLVAGGVQLNQLARATRLPKPAPGFPDTPAAWRSRLLQEVGQTPGPQLPPAPRFLGQGPGPVLRTKPGPPGPQTPDVGLYSKPLSVPPAPNLGGSAGQVSIGAQVAELDRLKTALDNPKDLQQLHDTLNILTQDQNQFLTELMSKPQLAGLIELRNIALSARLEGLRTLTGKSLDGASQIIGFDARLRLNQPFLDPAMLTQEPQVMGMLEWAHGLATEAGARGVNLQTVLGNAPLPQGLNDIATMGQRNKAVMEEILKEDPAAAVGPPDSLAGTVPSETKGFRSVATDPLVPQEMRDPTTMYLHDAPTAADLAERPSALREQMGLASQLAHGTEEQVGRLVVTKGDVYSTDVPEVPIIQDRAGRLFAEIPDPDGEGPILVEVTDDPSRAMLSMNRAIREVDGSYSSDPIDWEFAPNPFSSVAYKMENERLVIDPEATEKRSFVQEAHKNELHEAMRQGLTAPFENVVSTVDALRRQPPKTLEAADSVLNKLKEFSLEHQQKRPTVKQARSSFPDLNRYQILTHYADMLREYQGMASFIEAAKNQALVAKAQLLEEAGVLEPAISEMKVEGEGQARAIMQMDPRTIKIMGQNMYESKDIGKVIVKELLQNAKDAVLPVVDKTKLQPGEAHVSVDYRPADRTVLVTDRGHGISPKAAFEEMVDVGKTLKFGEGASGGFGIAKVAYLSNAERIHITSVWEDPATKEKVRTTITGSGDDWADQTRGLNVATEPVPSDTPTGTAVDLKLNEALTLSNYDTGSFLKNLVDFNRSPVKYSAWVNGQNIEERTYHDYEPVKNLEESSRVDKPTFSMEVLASKKKKPSGVITAIVLNNGLFQFERNVYLPDEANVPSTVVVDIHAKVKPEEEGYPWTLDRSSLRGEAAEILEEKVKTFFQEASSKEINQYKKMITEAQTIGRTGHKIFDPTGVVGEEEIRKISKVPAVAQISEMYNAIDLEIAEYLGKSSPVYLEAQFLGISLNGKHHGVNIKGSAIFDVGADNLIAFNPFNMYIEARNALQNGAIPLTEFPGFYASLMFGTAVHERTHQMNRSHGSEFGAHEMRNEAKLWKIKQDSIKKLTRLLGKNNGQIFDHIRQIAEELERTWATGTGDDVLSKVSNDFARREPPTPPSEEPVGPSAGAGNRPSRAVRQSGQDAPGMVDPSPESIRGDAEFAALRAEALHWASLGKSFSKKPKLFTALNAQERYDYLLHRISKGEVATRTHLDNLSPALWKSRGRGPKYFGGWMPTDAQLAVLQDAHEVRVQAWVRSEGIASKIRTNADARNAGAAKGPTRLTLEEVVEMDPAHVEALSKDPAQFDEWVRGFNMSQDAITTEIANEPDVLKREEYQGQFDVLKDLVLSMSQDRMWQGPHPSTDPRTPYAGIKRMTVNSLGRIQTIRGVLRTFGRPYGVLGPRKQIAHPKEYKKALERGDLARNVWYMGHNADLTRHQELFRINNEFNDLAEAAQHNEALDRAIFRHRMDETPDEALLKLPPEQRFHTVRRGVKTIKIDLAEWLPKLRKVYEEMITKAEDSLKYKQQIKALNYKYDGTTLEAEQNEILLQEAKKLDPALDTLDIVHPDTLEAIKKGLRSGESTNAKQFQKLQRNINTIKRLHDEAMDNIEAINNKAYRREGYITFIHRFTKDEIRRELSDPYSTYSRWTAPEVKNHFLNSRDSDKEPYHSWVTGWFLYLPTMMKTIHLEPALIAMEPKIAQLPTDMRLYAEEWIRVLKGGDALPDKIFNRMAFEGWMEEPSAVNTLINAVTGKDVVGKLRKDQAAKSELASPKLWSELMQGVAGFTYLALIGPVKVAKMTATEAGFILREAFKRPVDLPMSVMWSIFGRGEGTVDALHEFGSWLRSIGWQGPRFYSEASHMGVAESIHDLSEHYHDADLITSSMKRLFVKALRSWYFALRASEYWERASTYYHLRRKATAYGLSYKDACEHAAALTNDLIGQYGPRETSPMYRSQMWRQFMTFKRFPLWKTESFANDVAGGMGTAGAPFLRLMGREPVRAPNPQRREQGTSPPPPPPPKVPNSVFGEWTPEESSNWDEYSSAPSEFGAAYPRDPTANMRYSCALLGWLLAICPPIGLVYLIGKGVFQDEDENSVVRMTWPFDLSRLGQVASLSWIEDASKVGYLLSKKYAPGGGLNRKETAELKKRERNLYYILGGPMGRHQKLEDRKHHGRMRRPPALVGAEE